jgi:UDP-3-O-[3-hydroxymyristoyl] glucosamine N-acyltransferase
VAASGRGARLRLGELAERLGGRAVEGDPALELVGVASLEDGGPAELGFVRSARHADALAKSRVGAVIAPPDVVTGGRPTIRSAAPNLDIARAARLFAPDARPAAGVHPRAVVDPSAAVDATASVGACAVVGARTRVGPRAVVHPNVTLYEDVVVGADCVIHAGAVLREGTVLGERVTLQPGCVLGADGFGYEFDEVGQLEKVPQLGVVVVEDDAEIGALAAVDRARFGATRIGRGVKIDDLVMIGHNCTIGDGSAIVAQSGLAGSTVVGKRVFLMAQSGVANQATLGDGAFVGGRGGVVQDLAPGSRVYGYPAVPERAWHRAMLLLYRLPELARRVRRLEKRAGVAAAPGEER